MSVNSYATTPVYDPRLTHLVRVIVKKEDKFLCIYSIRNVGHTHCSGLEFPGGKVDIGRGLDGSRVTRETICKTAGRELFEETGLQATCLQVLSLDVPHPQAVGSGQTLCSVVFIHTVHDDGTNSALTPTRKEPRKQRYVKFLTPAEILSERSSFNGHWDRLFTDFIIEEKSKQSYPNVTWPLPSTIAKNRRNRITSPNSSPPSSVSTDHPPFFFLAPEFYTR